MNRLIAVFTDVMNHTLKQGDPHSFDDLRELEGTRIGVVMSPLTLHWHWQVKDGRIHVAVNSNEPVDCELRGSLFVFIKAMQSKSTSFFQKGELSFQGDVHVAEKWFSFLKRIDIDWEACLSNYVGDFFATRWMSGLRISRERQRQWSRDRSEDLEQFLKHEIACLPTREAVRLFLNDVDELSLAEARLSARVARLEKQ